MLGLTAPEIIARVITLLIAFTIHELAHAWVADQLGDTTPRRMGRLTLNPLAHLDPVGSLLLVFAGFGWAKPVMTNPYNFRNGPRLGMALVAAAGPFSNLLMAILAAIPFRLGLLELSGRFSTISGLLPTPEYFLVDFIQLNILLMLFNLLPIGPLDGMKVLRGFAPREWDQALNLLEQWGMFILLALVFLGQSVLSLVLGTPARLLINLILGR
ncbi:MAG: site-2 protease family protein [Anaerolineales bacterium]|nr:site-2 protease family protein [Anaerolineales bacterium]